ncbi:cell wall-binding protein [Desulfitobacterium dehalogenans ATCC 51507]|uniref:Cell wall-binding protein n=2 Tax=Desulfitobacterium dehalogenans TaxID=36854 RepID=I4ADA6_DESDJ|nr:cell wall-binding protein [Desulfitobacterium dehalogenans ATCC 51507]
MNNRSNMKFRRNDLKSRFKFLITWLLTACLLVYSPFGAVSVAAESDGVIMNDILDDNNSLEEPFFQIQSTTPSGITVTTPSAINYIEGISDRVIVTDLLPGDIVKVYDQATGGDILGQGTVASGETSVTIEIPQLGKGKGTVYVSVTSSGIESDRVEVDYVSEPIPWQIYGHTGNWGEDVKLPRTPFKKDNASPPAYPKDENGVSDDSPLGLYYNQHIIIKGSGTRVTFYGYATNAYKDFVLLPSVSTSKKTITFDMDLSKVNYHSMEGAGILLNSKIEAGKLYGYAILFTGAVKSDDSEDISKRKIRLFQINGVDINSFYNKTGTSGGELTSFSEIKEIVGAAVTPASGDQHSLELEITSDNVKLTDQVEGQPSVVLEQTLNQVNNAGNGFGFIASHIGHQCHMLSYFTITDVSISDADKTPYTWPLLDLTAKLSSEDPYGSVELNYTAPENAEVVILQYSTDSNFPEESTASMPLDPESAQTTVNGLKDNTKYYFRLLIGGGGNGGISNTADATTQENPNTAPTATSVSITGKLEVGQTLTGNYTYSDANGDLEEKGKGGTTFKWYRGQNQDGTGKVPIDGATSQTYTLGIEDQGQYIFFEVTPVAQTGVLKGSPVVSQGQGPVQLPSSMNLDGIVTDQKTDEKIAEATVILKDLSGNEIDRTKTDKDGKYSFNKVKLGKYKIVVENPQYSTKTTDIDVMPNSSNGTVRVDASGNLTLTKDVELVDFIITLVADPSSIVGDGKQTTTLHALITDKDNNPIPGIKVDFSALDGNSAIGSFPGGSEATTDHEGKCSVVYKSANLSGIESKTVIVRAEVDDDIKNLHAASEIIVTFEPSSIQGIVMDNATGKPVAGAIVEVAEDFDGDGIVDFYAKMITGSDGKYKIAVPKGNMPYNVNIAKPVIVDGVPLGEVTFTHTCIVGEITGAAKESFDSSKTITGVALMKAPDGSAHRLSGNSYEIELVDSNQNPVSLPPGSSALTSEGIFKADNLPPGTYTINLKHNVGGTGQKLTIGKAVATVTADGEIVISTILIDPYGTVTDRDTGLPISGVTMELYWADTKLNKDNGRTPGTLVALPADPAATNNNANPQPTSSTGYYAWMVIPDGDYYIIAKKSGYYTYDSRRDKRQETIGDSWIKDGIIHVGTDIVLYDLQMESRDRDRDDGGGGGSAPIGPVTPPITPPAENTSNLVNPQNPALVVPADRLTKKEILIAAINQYNEREKANAQKENRTPRLISVGHLNESAYAISSSNSSIADFDTNGLLNISGKGLFVIRISEKGTKNVYEYQMVASQGLQRLAGANRVDTALAIARGSYYGKVKSVVVARSDEFPDALTGSVLAYKKEAPVLLVGHSETDCQKLIEYLKGYLEPQGTVYILGGTRAVSQYVEDSVKDNGFSNIIRLGGADRYGTAARISEHLDVTQGRPVVIASGQSFPDSLSVSSIAAAQQFPLLIVNPNSIPDEIREELLQRNPSKVYIIGLQGAVSDGVRDEVAQLTGLGQENIVRIGGQDRYASTLAVAQYFDPSGRGVSIATGRDFPDALAGSVYSAKLKDPLILVGETLSTDLKNYLKVRKPSDIVIFGGQGAVSPAIEEQLKSLVE